MQARILSGGFFVFLSLSCLSLAQTTPAKPIQHNSRQAKAPGSVSSGSLLLSADDGLAILGAALAGRYRAESRSDCSHLVHAIYEQAGFPYKYQRSSDLYAGVEEFRRVTRPQPGDLIVWIGHAGIVVSPAQHTFYSALRSGFGMQPYDSVYWKRRGRPHFFRYMKAGPQTVLAANRTPAVEPAGFAPERDVDADSAEPRSADAHSSEGMTELTDRQPASDDPDATHVSDPAPQPALPKTVVVYATRLKVDQIGNALREQFQAFADTLETCDLLALQPAVMSFDRLDVQKVQLKGNKGSAQVRFSGAVALAHEGKGSKGRNDTQRVDLRRANGGWEILLPSNAIYLPRATVVRILAHQLAASTDNFQPDDSRPLRSRGDHQVQLARWLNMLLEPR